MPLQLMLIFVSITKYLLGFFSLKSWDKLTQINRMAAELKSIEWVLNCFVSFK